MAPSLRLRLLLGAACAIFAALAVAWLAMTFLFERHARRQLEAEMGERGMGLIAKLIATPDNRVAIDAPTSDPRFNTPASGFYWQVSGEGVLLRSRSLWDEKLSNSASITEPSWTSWTTVGPFEPRVIVVARRVKLDAETPHLVVALAANHARIAEARATFGRELAMFLVLLWAALSAAAWLQVRLGLQPLDDVRSGLENLRQRASARLAQTDYPVEVAPLANAINDLAQARERDLDQAQRRARNLAHSLNTPLAALSAQSRRAREAGAVAAADGLDRAISAAARAIEHELARAHAANSRGGSADAHAVAGRLIQVIERTEKGARLTFENAAPTTPLPVDESILTEILGPLMENAARFAISMVRVSGDALIVRVEDDGPGLTGPAAADALERGRRVDQHGEGRGLGLAIANELTIASGGELTLRRSSMGGLLAQVRWSTLSCRQSEACMTN